MRRVVALLVVLSIVGCRQREPELTKEQKAALQAMGEMQARVKATPTATEGWKEPDAFKSAGYAAETKRLRVKVTDVRRQSIKREPKLVIAWELTNLTENTKMDSAAPLELNPTIHIADEFGNTYLAEEDLSFDGPVVPEDYDYEPDSLYPGKSLTDATIIDAPVPNAKQLFVWFKGDFGASDDTYAFRLKIPSAN